MQTRDGINGRIEMIGGYYVKYGRDDRIEMIGGNYVKYGRDDRIEMIGGNYVKYGRDDRIEMIGGNYVKYGRDDRIEMIGGDYVKYDNHEHSLSESQPVSPKPLELSSIEIPDKICFDPTFYDYYSGHNPTFFSDFKANFTPSSSVEPSQEKESTCNQCSLF